MATNGVKRPASHQLTGGPEKQRVTRSVTRSLGQADEVEAPESPEPVLAVAPCLNGRRITRSIAKLLEARGIDPSELKEAQPMPWARLPGEIQTRILQAVAELIPERPYFRREFIARKYKNLNKHINGRQDLWMLRKTKPKTTRSVLATVSRQWQLFFEELNFRQLVLHQNDLKDFNSFTETHLHRRQFLQKIYLRLELKEYGCGQCTTCENPEEEGANYAITRLAVKTLFHTLSSWDPAACYRDGLTLEMSAHSPSDATCYARELHHRIADSTHTNSFRYIPSAWYLGRVFTDPSRQHCRHGWWVGRRYFTSFPFERRMLMVQRVFSYSKDPRYTFKSVELPDVACVRHLLIRRQFYRDLGYQALRKIISSLSNLYSLRHESWGPVSLETNDVQSWDFECLLREVIQDHPALKKVSFYGCTNSAYHFNWDMYNQRSLMPIGAVEGNILERSKELTIDTKQMEEIHGARNICAEGFFYYYRPYDLDIITLTSEAAEYDSDLDPEESLISLDDEVYLKKLEGIALDQWPNLTHLSLSSTLLNSPNINWLLTAAGRAAKNMPKLKMMELWNYDPKSRALFRYASNQGGSESGLAQIELYTSWSAPGNPPLSDFDTRKAKKPLLTSETKEAWREAVKAHVVEEHRQTLLFDEYVWDRPGDFGPCVIKHLKMKERILTPKSLEQLEREGWEAPT